MATTNASTTAVITAVGACSIAGNTVTMISGTGSCVLAASWAADNNYIGAAAGQSTVATRANSGTSITSNSPNPSGVGQVVATGFKVAGAGIPTGSVTVMASTGESCSGALSAGAGSCSLMFTSVGSRTLTASYLGDGNFNGSTSTPVTQSVTGPQIGLSQASINFGNVPLGSLVYQTETVSNPGNAKLNISGVSVKLGPLSDKDDFTFINFCGSSLAPGASCNIVVVFFADDLGARAATLVITDNATGSPQNVPLTGTVVKHK
jgi:hypothetical protein